MDRVPSRPPGKNGKRRLVESVSDEFEGDSLNENKWELVPQYSLYALLNLPWSSYSPLYVKGISRVIVPGKVPLRRVDFWDLIFMARRLAFLEPISSVSHESAQALQRKEDADINSKDQGFGSPGGNQNDRVGAAPSKPSGNDDRKSSKSKRARRKPQYARRLVLEPVQGLYDRYVLQLDFNSLYSSFIQEFNICFTTLHLDENRNQDGRNAGVTLGPGNDVLERRTV
ncbi:DNA polymerase alpha catalytic subunit [Gracilaria domingensis]|nr:DNA polymerase alpha catalytic subunit [Gracilaria domingensis]